MTLTQLPTCSKSLTLTHLPRTSTPSTLPIHPRLNGFERPFSRDQVISWIGHAVSGLNFFMGAAGVSLFISKGDREEQDTITLITTLTLITVVVHVLNSTILVTSWRACETIDPAVPVDTTLPTRWWHVRLNGPRWDKTRYCALCRKAVPGLDHHCTWLQTCIGKANYAHFFTVACTGTVQFVLQVVYAGLCLWWLHYSPLDDAKSTVDDAVASCLIVCLVISVPCMFMYFVLVGFHLWLSVLGYGTYEWMLRRRKKQRVKLETKKATSHTREIVSTSHAIIKVPDIKLDEQERARELTVL